MASNADHTRSNPIPQSLWEQAIALTATFPITRVAHAITGGRQGVEKALYGPSRHTLCAELHHPGLCGSPTATASWPKPPFGTEIDIDHRADGAWLRVQAHEPQLSLATLLQTFLEPR